MLSSDSKSMNLSKKTELQSSLDNRVATFLGKDCHIPRGELFYVLPCVILFLRFFSLFSIAVTSHGEERASLGAFHSFVRFALVWFCLFPLPFGFWDRLRFVIVALPGLFPYPPPFLPSVLFVAV